MKRPTKRIRCGGPSREEPRGLDGPRRPQAPRGESTQTKAVARCRCSRIHLERIRILVPEPALSKLETIEIWIDHEHPKLGGMQYHPSRGWLVGNGHDPRLAKKVHITKASQLLSRGQMLKHPAVVLHELAHGYHDQFLSFDNEEIIAAFRAAEAKGNL